MIGKIAADTPLIMINHFEDEVMGMKYLPQVKNLCLQEERSCIEFTEINDGILVNTNSYNL